MRLLREGLDKDRGKKFSKGVSSISRATFEGKEEKRKKNLSCQRKTLLLHNFTGEI